MANKNYTLKYAGEEIDALLGKASTALQEHQDISGKQDVIEDLDDIRSKANSALQEIPAEYVNETELNDAIASIDIPTVDLTGYATESWVEDKGYLTQHQDISGKQDVITDLDSIRSGASLGATALQSIPSEYVTITQLNEAIASAITTTLNTEV